MKKLFVVLFLLALILTVDNSENVSAKSSANKKADKAYMKLVKNICEEKDVYIRYCFKDLIGDGVHEAIIQYHPKDGGSGDVFQIYSYENGKTKLILDDGGYGIYQLYSYKNSQTIIIFQSGHGHESQLYYKMTDGEFRCELGKGRSNAGETGPWYYYSYKTYDELSKSEFTKLKKELCKGKKVKFDCGSGYSSYYEKSHKESIKELIDDVYLFELAMLVDHNIEYGKVDLTNELMARAAAISTKDNAFLCYDQDDLENLGEDLASCYYSFSEEEFVDNGKNLFGKTLKLNYLPTKINSWIYDAYKDKTFGYVIFSSTDPEDIYEVLSLSVKKKGSSYTAVKKLYWGYAGSYKNEANRQITYTFKKFDDSKYGFIITGIEITKI